MSDIIKYYQTIPELGIKGRMNTPEEFDLIGLPKNLTGKNVLDIGCNMGAFLFESIARNANAIIGVEPNNDWRWLAWGILSETDYKEFEIFRNLNEVPNYHYDLVLLLSVTHLDEVDNPQAIVDKAWELTAEGGLLIVEINDRLQRKEVKLPNGKKLFGKNKDNRSVYHCIKNNA